MTTVIKAIETEYAGCRFRSRLEARWAVFFDHLGIKWEYEHEGLDIDGVRYLPDFVLPAFVGIDLFVEVKGHMDERGMEKVLALAGAGRMVLVLRNVPRPDELGPHFLLFRGDEKPITAHWVSMFPIAREGRHFTLTPHGWPLDDRGGPAQVLQGAVKLANEPAPGGFVLVSTPVGEAFEAARSARFEFGERG